MLLTIDVGNSNTSLGLFEKDGKLQFLASLDTDSRKTADQISIDLINLFALYHFQLSDLTDAIVCSVVPPINFMLEKALTHLRLNLHTEIQTGFDTRSHHHGGFSQQAG